MTKYSIEPLQVRDIPHGRTYLMIGKRNTGKTTLLRDLMFHRRKYLQFGIAIAGSAGSSKSIRAYHPDTYIKEDFDPIYLKKFWDYICAVNGKRTRRNLPMINFYIILDDTGFDSRMWNDKTLKAMMMNGRQYNLDCYMCLQYMKGITTDMRGQIDYCFIFREKAPENIKKLYDTFAGGYFENKTIFETVFRSCTKDKRALVVRNCDIPDESAQFDGGIYFYRAKVDHPEFVIGCERMWRHHYRVYNEHYASDEEEEKLRAVRGEGPSDLLEAPKKRSEIQVTLRKPTLRAAAKAKVTSTKL